MITIVGLGNIGEHYQNTRHNIGFYIVDYLASYYSFPAYKSKFQSLYSESIIDKVKTVLLKPQTFMNLSGSAVSSFCSFYKIKQDSVIVIQDDLDMTFNDIRYKTNSSDGGQKGIRDIHNKFGKNIHRIKIGIGRPTTGDISSFVLSKFNLSEQQILEKTAENIAINLNLLIKKDFINFINNIKNNRRT